MAIAYTTPHGTQTSRLELGGPPKGHHDGLGGGAVVRTGTDVPEREVSVPIEDEVTAHLRQVELLRMPDPSPQDQTDVTPHRARRRDCSNTPASRTQTVVAEALGIGEP